jgi:hypothetical protein
MGKESRMKKTTQEEPKLIKLTQGKFAIVDWDDYDWLNQYKWYTSKGRNNYYALRRHKEKIISMHRVILEAAPGQCCDHINHDGLDNRRSNLRLCTPAQNVYNSRPKRNCVSQYKGVRWCVERKKWLAKIYLNEKEIFIGYFDYELDAAIAYDDWAIKLFGEFAYLNIQYRPEIQQWLRETYLFLPEKARLQPVKV